MASTSVRTREPSVFRSAASFVLEIAKNTLWPGATVLYPLGQAFVGGDARFLVRDSLNAFSVFATGGVQF